MALTPFTVPCGGSRRAARVLLKLANQQCPRSESTRGCLIASRFPLTLLVVAIVFSACLMPAQSDTWWHLRTGEEIWRSGRILLHDTFTHTVSGRPWPDHEWLTQVLFYAVYAAGEASAPDSPVRNRRHGCVVDSPVTYAGSRPVQSRARWWRSRPVERNTGTLATASANDGAVRRNAVDTAPTPVSVGACRRFFCCGRIYTAPSLSAVCLSLRLLSLRYGQATGSSSA